MSNVRLKPVNHGRDHSPGGADPIPGLSGGIAFDTYPQAGQWLYIETDGPDTSPSGFGMELFDDGGNGIDLNSSGAHLALNAFGSGEVRLEGGAPTVVNGSPLNLGGGTDGVNISAHDHIDVYATSVFGVDPLLHLRSDRYITIESGSTSIAFDPSGTFDWLLSAATPTIHLTNITSAEVFRIEDGSGNSLLEVRGDGTFHIKTGATWAADL